ncbi:MAG: hypothetical protein NTX17_06815 [Candidatus Eisenbacteria bacterium]|nr:hypothetical protein [Candidatus Eisenbacteria bacterium]
MARYLGLMLSCILFSCLLISACGNACAQAALEVKGNLALADPLIGPLDSEPALLLAQKAIEEPVTATEKTGELGSSRQVEKSPAKAFLFSGMVPGSGELYVGAKRGYIFLGVEAVAWASSYFLRESGNKKEEEFEDFADRHWAFPAIGSEYNGSVYTAQRDSLMQYFYVHNKQHYYEDIGKQPFCMPGWDSTVNLESYLDMRDNSNWLLKNSNYAMMAAVVNHVVSAVDALRLARNYNASLGHGMKLNLKLKTNPHSMGIIMVASRKF